MEAVTVVINILKNLFKKVLFICKSKISRGLYFLEKQCNMQRKFYIFILSNCQQSARVELFTPRLLFLNLSNARNGPWQGTFPFLPSSPLQKSSQISAPTTCSNAVLQLSQTGAEASAQRLFPFVGLSTNKRLIAELQLNHVNSHLTGLHNCTGDDNDSIELSLGQYRLLQPTRHPFLLVFYINNIHAG